MVRTRYSCNEHPPASKTAIVRLSSKSSPYAGRGKPPPKIRKRRSIKKRSLPNDKCDLILFKESLIKKIVKAILKRILDNTQHDYNDGKPCKRSPLQVEPNVIKKVNVIVSLRIEEIFVLARKDKEGTKKLITENEFKNAFRLIMGFELYPSPRIMTLGSMRFNDLEYGTNRNKRLPRPGVNQLENSDRHSDMDYEDSIPSDCDLSYDENARDGEDGEGFVSCSESGSESGSDVTHSDDDEEADDRDEDEDEGEDGDEDEGEGEGEDEGEGEGEEEDEGDDDD